MRVIDTEKLNQLEAYIHRYAFENNGDKCDIKLQKRRFSGVTVLQKSRGNSLQNSEKKRGKCRK